MKTVLITGATGYIGSHVVKHMLDCGWNVGIVVRPSSSLRLIDDVVDRLEVFRYDGEIVNLIDFISKFSPDVVVHLAAAVITNAKTEDIKKLVRSNIEFGSELLEAMSQCGVKAFVNTGTFWQNYNSKEYNPVDFYAATKEAFEKIIKYYVDAHGFKVITLRLYDVYGEDDPRPKLWNQLKSASVTHATLEMTAGEQLVNLVHISDVAEAYIRACQLVMECDSGCDLIFDVRNSVMLSLKIMVKEFFSSTGCSPDILWSARPYREREVMIPECIHPLLPGWIQTVDYQSMFTKFNNRGGVRVSHYAIAQAQARGFICAA